jgi:transcriptional regulator with XRE-family HTH domain
LKEDFDTIGKRIRSLREVKNLKRKDIAELLDISEGNLHSMENDKTNPSAIALIKLTKFFKVTSDWILLGDQINEEGEKVTDINFNLTVPDREMAIYLAKIIDVWKNGDERIKTWVMVQLEKAFPEVAEEKKRKEQK